MPNTEQSIQTNLGTSTDIMNDTPVYESIISGYQHLNNAPINENEGSATATTLFHQTQARRYNNNELRTIINGRYNNSEVQLLEAINRGSTETLLDRFLRTDRSMEVNFDNVDIRRLSETPVRFSDVNPNPIIRNIHDEVGEHIDITDLYPSMLPSILPSMMFTRAMLTPFSENPSEQPSQDNTEIDEDINYINSNKYIPEKFIFHKVSNEEEMYLGVELEIDDGGKDNDIAKYVCNYMNQDSEHVYCKSDSSLDDGFEIVTQPCTFEYHSSIKSKYESLFKYLSKNKYKSHDTTTCGFHIHINRNYFGERKLEQDLGIGKFIYLLAKYFDKLTSVARRVPNRYAKRIEISDNSSIIDMYATAIDIGKYSFVNLMHKDTVEIRSFKGTLNCDTFILTLEFVKKMALAAKNADMYSIESVTWDDIQSSFSAELVKYMESRGEAVMRYVKRRQTANGSMGTYATGLSEVPNYAGDFDGDTIPAMISFSGRGYSNLCFDSLPGELRYPNSRQQPRRELTDEEIVMRDITDLKSKLRRCRNDFERMNINRRISRLELLLRTMRLHHSETVQDAIG